MTETRELLVDLGDDGVLRIPYVDVVGEAGDGPHLTVIAGVHGTEYTSIAAARVLLAELRPAELSGTVTVAPVINLPAFWSRTPFVVPLDEKNLNRSFPGDAHGTAAERIAAAVTETLIKGSDYLIDLHAGDLPEALEPFACTTPRPSSSRPAASPSPTASGTWCGNRRKAGPLRALPQRPRPTSASPRSPLNRGSAASSTRTLSTGTCAGCGTSCAIWGLLPARSRHSASRPNTKAGSG